MVTPVLNCTVLERRVVFCGQTALRYVKLVEECYHSVVNNERRDLLFKGVLLFYDNLCLHSMAAITEAVRQLKFELLTHTPYGLD